MPETLEIIVGTFVTYTRNIMEITIRAALISLNRRFYSMNI